MKNLFNKLPLLGCILFALAAIVGLFIEPEALMMLATGPLVSTSEDRAAFGRFANQLQKLGIIGAGETPIVTETDLRLEQDLVASKNNYEFDLLKGTSNTDGPLENKLNNNDIFFATGISVCVYKTDGTNPEALYTYPDMNYFSAAGEALSLETIFNGKLSMSEDNTQRIKDMLLLHMRFVPGVQYDSTDNIHPAYGPLLEERGFKRTHPNFLIDGSKSNKVNILLGQGSTAAIAGASPKKNVMTVLIHGFLFSGKVATDGCMV